MASDNSFKVYKISKLTPIGIEPTCPDICTNNCAYFMSIKTLFCSNDKIQPQKCYKILQSKLLRNEESFEPFLRNNEVLQMIKIKTLKYGVEDILVFQLDSGAQCSVISNSIFMKHFPKNILDKCDPKTTLVAADGRNIKVLGQLMLNLCVLNTCADVLFYVIESGSSCLLGLTDLITLNILIDCGRLKSKADYKVINKHSVYRISDSSSVEPVPRVTTWTISKIYNVEIGKTVSITLVTADKMMEPYIYTNALIFDCSCLEAYKEDLNNFMPCATCQLNRPALSSTISPDNKLHFLYKPLMSVQLVPKTDYFYGIICPTADLIHRCLYKEYAIKNILVQEPGLVFTEQAIF